MTHPMKYPAERGACAHYETLTDDDVAFLKPLWWREYAREIGLATEGSRHDITSDVVLPYLMRRLGWRTVHREAATMLLVVTPERHA